MESICNPSVLRSQPTAELPFAALAQRALHPAFDSLRDWIDQLCADTWPTLDVLNALSQGAPRFVAAELARDLPYEQQIFDTGEIPTRSHNWHDFFNALIWLAYPCAKRALNAQHARILAAGGEAERRRRSPMRDTLTLFDEGGAVVVYTDPTVAALIDAFAWKQLFWNQRDHLKSRYRVFLFGHAALERLLDPPVGLTNKCLMMPVSADFFDRTLPQQRADVDRFVAACAQDLELLSNTRNLRPLPVLGVPGFHALSATADFYDDTAYFRPNYQKVRSL